MHRVGWLNNMMKERLTMRGGQRCLSSCFISLLGCCSCAGCLRISRNITISHGLSKDSTVVAVLHTRATHHFTGLRSSHSCSMLFDTRAKRLINNQLYFGTSRGEGCSGFLTPTRAVASSLPQTESLLSCFLPVLTNSLKALRQLFVTSTGRVFVACFSSAYTSSSGHLNAWKFLTVLARCCQSTTTGEERCCQAGAWSNPSRTVPCDGHHPDR